MDRNHASISSSEDSDSSRRKVQSLASGTRLGQAVRGAPLKAAVGLLGLGLLATLLVGCGGQAVRVNAPLASGTAVGSTNTITVSGRATVNASPDEAVITISVETAGKDPASALDANSKTTKTVGDRLTAEGVPSDAVQTSNVSVYPDRAYDPKTGKDSITGYRATNSVVVTLRDAATVGKVLASAVETGATTVTGPVWQVAVDSASLTEALTKAVANAREKAQALAEAQGVKLGGVVSMTEGTADQPTVPQYDSAKTAAGSSVETPPVSAGTIEITGSMTVTYSLTN